ncbi:MAG TPA: hypothetical protein VJ732_06325 [Bryobacteraceae bacterium]|nr:hypothetical protein [Bryobacteraceae bacterium]
MSDRTEVRRWVPLGVVAAALCLMPSPLLQAQGRGGPQGPPPTGRLGARIDLTGYWVSIVTEDWRWRMVTPAKGDYASVPLNAEGRRVADTWDPAKDEASGNQCRAYGASGIMRVPERLHITWQDDNTLKIETDAGEQTRLFHFAGKPPQNIEPSWQGYSVATWNGPPLPRRGAQAQGATQTSGPGALQELESRGGSLQVVTNHLRPGYLRKNGVPYSANTLLTEYYDRTYEPNGDSWLIVTTIVDDPQYLQQPFITSTHFKKLPDASGWHPAPCTAR